MLRETFMASLLAFLPIMTGCQTAAPLAHPGTRSTATGAAAPGTAWDAAVPPPTTAQPAPASSGPWRGLWERADSKIYSENREELDDADWNIARSEFFNVYYSADPDYLNVLKVRNVAARLDGIYRFLNGRLDVQTEFPIRIIIVPGFALRSAIDPEENIIRLGDGASWEGMLASIFRELIFLFNRAQAPAVRSETAAQRTQNVWSGEIFAQYHSDRFFYAEADLLQKYRFRLENQPGTLSWSEVAELSERTAKLTPNQREERMTLGVSILYFLEEAYGASSLVKFWKLHLDANRQDDPDNWRECFGKPYRELEAEWRRYYGQSG